MDNAEDTNHLKMMVTTEKRTLKNINLLKELIRVANKIAYDAPYMDNEPNGNTDYQRAIAEQMMIATSHSLMIRDNLDDVSFDGNIKRAMSLRSLIEITANLYLFSKNKDDDELGKRFLKTHLRAGEALQKIYERKKVIRWKWTNESISKRIRNMENATSTEYSDLYFYLSSYVHSDAGVTHSLIHLKSHRLTVLFLSWTLFCMMDLMHFLEEAGVLNEHAFKAFLKEASERLAEIKEAES